MIFVTVGTHEQQFNRLLREIDKLKEDEIIKEEVFIQTGYSTYEPKYCEWKSMVPYKEMQQLISQASIVITHGGPSSFVAPLQVGKIPVVVPRKADYEEHVNNHQVDFVKMVAERQKNIVPVYEIEELENVLLNYDEIVKGMPKEMRSNNAIFNQKLEEIVNTLVKG